MPVAVPHDRFRWEALQTMPMHENVQSERYDAAAQPLSARWLLPTATIRGPARHGIQYRQAGSYLRRSRRVEPRKGRWNYRERRNSRSALIAQCFDLIQAEGLFCPRL